jgi:hypothetical protein
MFKKFSSLLIIFAVAISLIVLSQTESNAQVGEGCGRCGQPDCILTLVHGNWIWTSYAAEYDIEGFAPITPNIFIASSVYVRQGCLACLNPVTGEERFDNQTIIGTTAQFFSSAEENLQSVGDGLYTFTQEVCATVVEEVCGECDGKVRELTLRYDGDEGAQIAVYQHKIDNATFDEYVGPGGEFTISGMDKWQGTLGPKISVNRDNNTITEIHTSCSDPVGPGSVIDDFTVISGYSQYGGRLCPFGATLDGGECLEEEFESIWNLPVNACAFEGFMPSQLRVQSLYLTGRLLDCTLDAEGNPYLDDNGQPDDCSEQDIICLSCETGEFCRSWNADGEVTYVCEEIDCPTVVPPPTLDGLGVTGTVLNSNYPGQSDWPVPNSTINLGFGNIEFIREVTNTTTTADFARDFNSNSDLISNSTLTLRYENISQSINITYSPLTYTFEFENDINLTAVNLQSSTFTHPLPIIVGHTSNSITLEVPGQNTNPGEVFEATFELIF